MLAARTGGEARWASGRAAGAPAGRAGERAGFGPRAPAAAADSPRGGLRLGERAPRLPAGRAASGRCAGLRGAGPAGGSRKRSAGREGALRAVRRAPGSGRVPAREGDKQGRGGERSQRARAERRGRRHSVFSLSQGWR